MTQQEQATKVLEVISWMQKSGYDRKASQEIAVIIAKYLSETTEKSGEVKRQEEKSISDIMQGIVASHCEMLIKEPDEKRIILWSALQAFYKTLNSIQR